MSRAFVCRCEDVDRHEVDAALAAGCDDLESLRRYTGIGTGPCQGKACLAECVRLLSARHGVPEAAVGIMTMRPPLLPIPLGLLAGLDDATLSEVLSDSGRAAALALRDAMDGEPRTGRATPASLRRAREAMG